MHTVVSMILKYSWLKSIDMPSFKMPVFIMNTEFKILSDVSLFPSYWQHYNFLAVLAMKRV